MSRRNKDSLVEAVFMALAVIAFVVGAAFMRTSAPCSWFGWVPASEVPARCLMHR